MPVLPRISNHTDFEPLAHHPQVELRYIDAATPPPPADLVILPGSKSVRADLEWLRARGWPEYLAKHLRYGGKVLGICGGMQMLGRVIADPDGIEGDAGESPGLGSASISRPYFYPTNGSPMSPDICGWRMRVCAVTRSTRVVRRARPWSAPLF